MKVKMLKAHQGMGKGQTVEVEDKRGSYWIGMGVAKKARETKNAAPKNLEDK